MLHKIVSLVLVLSAAHFANADIDGCEKYQYKDGWLKKYEHKGNTWGANTKKHGLLSSTIGAYLESTTSSVDPGVTTNKAMSSVQFTSSWGECAAVEMFYVKNFRKNYIEQNLDEVKKEIAMGRGRHVETLAHLSGCRHADSAVWSQTIQSLTPAIYDLKDGAAIGSQIDSMILKNSDLSQKCWATPEA